jgi:putative membrane-bound dehydrogenase-like protein
MRSILRHAVICGLICTTASLAPVSAQKKPLGAEEDVGSQLPRIAPRSPAEALTTFRLKSGFRIELVASEPLIRSPVALDFDEDGRMFVAEFPEYNQYANKHFKGHGCIKLLEDTRGNGRFDKATVFLENVDSPVAVACYRGGIFVGAAPDLIYCKDTRGTGTAGRREVVLTGFGKDEAGEAMLNSFRWGLDNRFHLSTSLAGGDLRRAGDKNGRPVSIRGQGLLFDPRTYAFELASGGGQHGMSMDDWGLTFVCGNSDPIEILMYERRYIARNPYVRAPAPAVNVAPDGKFTKLFRISPNEPWRVVRTRLRSQGIVAGSDEGGQPSGFFTGATGVTVYRGDAWPPDYRGSIFVGEVANNLVYRARLQAKGIAFTAARADEGEEFLASTDNWFRPVQFANAPDGTLYVIDMCREFIEAAVSVPPEILKHLDVSSGIDRGRIYRIVPDGFKQPKPPKLSKASIPDLVTLLEHPNGWHRDTAARLLYERQDLSAVTPLRKLAEHSTSALGRLHAMYALGGLNSLSADLVAHALADSDSHVREHAVRLAEAHPSDPVIRCKLEQLIADPEPRVRYQLAFSLGQLAGDAATRALSQLAVRDGHDPWMRLAILSSAADRRALLFQLLWKDQSYRASAAGKTLLLELATEVGAANRPPEIGTVVTAINELSLTADDLSRALVLALVNGAPSSVRDRLTGTAHDLVVRLLQEARQTALDPHRNAIERSQAVRTLSLSNLEQVSQVYQLLLNIRQPQGVQKAVLEMLARYDRTEVPEMVLGSWPTLTPQLRATATETLLSRPAWVGTFLDAVENGKIRPADIDPARVRLLQTSTNAPIRVRTAKLFPKERPGKRQDVVTAYQPALQIKGDAGRGTVLFKNVCSSCHRLDGVGEAIGADLSAIRDRGNASILLNILDPNREVQPRYLTYVISTDDGRLLTGMITAETANGITVRRPDGTSETVLRAQIEAMRSTGLSFMPEGLEKQIDLPGMADLLAYLTSKH